LGSNPIGGGVKQDQALAVPSRSDPRALMTPALKHSIEGMPLGKYISATSWDVECTDEFGHWWAELSQ